MVRLREYDRDDIAMQLIEWAQKDDSINLNAFCGQLLLDPSKISIWAKEEESFRKAYKIAKSLIAARRELRLSDNSLHQKAYDLNATVYDHFLHEAKREQAEFEAEMKKKSESNQSNTFIFQSNIPDANNNPVQIPSTPLSDSYSSSTE